MAEGLRADGLQTLTDMYPVLRRHLWTTVDNWHASSRELLTRASRSTISFWPKHSTCLPMPSSPASSPVCPIHTAADAQWPF
jgi:hypothetical protein